MKCLACPLFVGMFFFHQVGAEIVQQGTGGLIGIWKLVSIHGSGQDLGDFAKDLRLKFSDEKVEINYGGNFKLKLKYKLDLTKMPRQIDVISAGDNQPRPGIYDVYQNTLKICINLSNKEGRPKQFATDANRPHIALLQLERLRD